MDNISVGSNNNIEQEWQARLIAVGVSVRASAWLNLPQFGVVNFDGKLPENYPNWTKLDEAWQRHRQQIFSRKFANTSAMKWCITKAAITVL